jgi:hypothetical protein
VIKIGVGCVQYLWPRGGLKNILRLKRHGWSIPMRGSHSAVNILATEIDTITAGREN